MVALYLFIPLLVVAIPRTILLSIPIQLQVFTFSLSYLSISANADIAFWNSASSSLLSRGGNQEQVKSERK